MGKKKGSGQPTSDKTNLAASDGDEAPQTLKAQANALVASGDHRAAAALLTRAIAMQPSDLHLYHSNRSLCALSLKDYQLAIGDANKCIELQPKWAKGYSRLGAALFFSGKAAEAAKAYAQGLAIEPTNDTLLQGLQSANFAIKAAKEPEKQPAVDVSDGARTTIHTNRMCVQMRAMMPRVCRLTRVLLSVCVCRCAMHPPQRRRPRRLAAAATRAAAAP